MEFMGSVSMNTAKLDVESNMDDNLHVSDYVLLELWYHKAALDF